MKTAVVTANICPNGLLVYITPQSFRRAHPTWRAMRGVSESVLQKLLGHAAGSSVTKRFHVHATEEAKRAAVIELPIGQRADIDAPHLAISGNTGQNRGDATP